MSRPNFIPAPVRDFTSKIRAVVDKTECDRHAAPRGIPCWYLRTDSPSGQVGICNVRAVKLFNGAQTTIVKKGRR